MNVSVRIYNLIAKFKMEFEILSIILIDEFELLTG